MGIECRRIIWCIGILVPYLCTGLWAYPIHSDTTVSLDSPSDSTVTPSLTINVIIVILGGVFCIITIVIGCLCCENGVFKGFESVSNGREHGGYIGASSPGTEFTIFPPRVGQNADHHGSLNDIKFDPLPDIRPRGRTLSGSQKPRPANFSNTINRGLSVEDWFEDPSSNFPRHQLQYLQEVGSGWFGQVVEGEAQGISRNAKKTKVVVKILREDATPTDQIYFLHEVKAFRDLDHSNVIKLLGKCLETDPFLIILEHCAFKDLKTYLIQHRTESESLVQGNLLLRMAVNVAAGLQHMHANNFIHTDLAVRNCLVGTDLQVKIGDYGNSIEKFKEDYYCAADVAVPIRWCAPETLRCTETTIETKEVSREANIWSFGVVIWEILEFGKLPYAEWHEDDVLQKVVIERSLQLSQPLTDCAHKDKIFQVMQLCWLFDPKLRPNMAKVHAMVTHLHAHCDNSRSPTADFEMRWHNLQPRTSRITNIPITAGGDAIITAALSPQQSFETDFTAPIPTSPSPHPSLSFDGDFAPTGSPLSPSLQNLRGSLEELTAMPLVHATSESNLSSRSSLAIGEPVDRKPRSSSVDVGLTSSVLSAKEVQREFDAWLVTQQEKGVEESKIARQISEAIITLDAAIADEKGITSSSEGDSTQTTPERDLAGRSAPEEASLNSMEPVMELVREKSQSVQDFLTLTVIDNSDNSDESGPPSVGDAILNQQNPHGAEGITVVAEIHARGDSEEEKPDGKFAAVPILVLDGGVGRDGEDSADGLEQMTSTPVQKDSSSATDGTIWQSAIGEDSSALYESAMCTVSEAEIVDAKRETSQVQKSAAVLSMSPDYSPISSGTLDFGSEAISGNKTLRKSFLEEMLVNSLQNDRIEDAQDSEPEVKCDRLSSMHCSECRTEIGKLIEDLVEVKGSFMETPFDDNDVGLVNLEFERAETPRIHEIVISDPVVPFEPDEQFATVPAKEENFGKEDAKKKMETVCETENEFVMITPEDARYFVEGEEKAVANDPSPKAREERSDSSSLSTMYEVEDIDDVLANLSSGSEDLVLPTQFTSDLVTGLDDRLGGLQVEGLSEASEDKFGGLRLELTTDEDDFFGRRNKRDADDIGSPEWTDNDFYRHEELEDTLVEDLLVNIGVPQTPARRPIPKDSVILEDLDISPDSQTQSRTPHVVRSTSDDTAEDILLVNIETNEIVMYPSEIPCPHIAFANVVETVGSSGPYLDASSSTSPSTGSISSPESGTACSETGESQHWKEVDVSEDLFAVETGDLLQMVEESEAANNLKSPESFIDPAEDEILAEANDAAARSPVTDVMQPNIQLLSPDVGMETTLNFASTFSLRPEEVVTSSPIRKGPESPAEKCIFLWPDSSESDESESERVSSFLAEFSPEDALPFWKQVQIPDRSSTPENPDYPPDWENDSEDSTQSGSSTSGEFDCTKAGRQTPKEVGSTNRNAESNAVADTAVVSAPTVRISTWDKDATPTRSALKSSPEKKLSDVKKSVSFEIVKKPLIYEYPKQKQWDESPPRTMWNAPIFRPNDISYTDWELGEDEIPEDIVEVEDFDVDDFHRQRNSGTPASPMRRLGENVLYKLSDISDEYDSSLDESDQVVFVDPEVGPITYRELYEHYKSSPFFPPPQQEDDQKLVTLSSPSTDDFFVSCTDQPFRLEAEEAYIHQMYSPDYLDEDGVEVTDEGVEIKRLSGAEAGSKLVLVPELAQSPVSPDDILMEIGNGFDENGVSVEDDESLRRPKLKFGTENENLIDVDDVNGHLEEITAESINVNVNGKTTTTTASSADVIVNGSAAGVVSAFPVKLVASSTDGDNNNVSVTSARQVGVTTNQELLI